MLVPATTSSCTCRAQLTVPSEPVQMPWSAIEPLDVQFGSIGFLDNTEVCNLKIWFWFNFFDSQISEKKLFY